jgi:hypothetical protein
MRNFNDKIKDYEKSSPLKYFYEFGATPDEIKSEIITTFSRYFQNEDKIKELSINYLIDPWLSYLTIYRDFPDTLHFIEKIIKILNDAKIKNQQEVIKNYATHIPDFSQGISRY